MEDHFDIRFFGNGMTAQCPANPEFPYGIAIDLAEKNQKACTAKLPYPAPCIGRFMVKCGKCGRSILVSAAGRADDPTQVKIACQIQQPVPL